MRVRSVGVALVAAVVLTVAAIPATAVINGRPDGNQNPNVGMIIASDAIGPLQICTGTLVTPTIVLTTAHCVQPSDPEFGPLTYAATFDSQVPLDSSGFPTVPASAIPGTPDPNPAFPGFVTRDRGDFLQTVEQDIGLLRLAQPASTNFPGITPASIVGPSALDRYRTGRKPNVLQVGYGLNCTRPSGASRRVLRGRSEKPVGLPAEEHQGVAALRARQPQRRARLRLPQRRRLGLAVVHRRQGERALRGPVVEQQQWARHAPRRRTCPGLPALPGACAVRKATMPKRPFGVTAPPARPAPPASRRCRRGPGRRRAARRPRPRCRASGGRSGRA